MAPVAGRVADGEQDRLVLTRCVTERLRPPRSPVDGIVLVLEEVGARFLGEAVRHLFETTPQASFDPSALHMMRRTLRGGSMKDLTVIMDDQPGKLADLGEAAGRAGVNIEGLCAMVGDGKGFIHLLVEDADAARKALEEAGISVADEREAVIVDLHDKPGAMGEIARDLADAGVNIDVAYTIFTGVRLVILTEDVEAAREALDLNGAAG